MSLKHAILVLLERQPSSGYDLAQRFKAGIGNFWNASHQQVYQELKKLHRETLVKFAVEAQSGRPDRKVYRITARGHKALRDWLHKPLKPPRINTALLVKIYGAHLAKTDKLLAELDQHLAFHRQQLGDYLAMEQGYFSQAESGRRKYLLPYLTLRRGIRNEQGWLEWLAEVREVLMGKGLPRAPVLKSAKTRKTSAASADDLG